MTDPNAARAARRLAARAGRVCEHCGAALATRRSTMRFCSTLCRVTAHRRRPPRFRRRRGVQIFRLSQLDGTLANLALMRLAAFHRARGDDIVFTRSPYRDRREPSYASVYGSALFSFSADRVARLKNDFPSAIVGGTWDRGNLTVEDLIGPEDCGLAYRDDQFERRRLYTAWDNIGDERRFFRGVDCLAAHGVKPSHLMAYMLVGYDRRETWETVLYRFNRISMAAKPLGIVLTNASVQPVEEDIYAGYGARDRGKYAQLGVIRAAVAALPTDRRSRRHACV
jgi:hypothetical protein